MLQVAFMLIVMHYLTFYSLGSPQSWLSLVKVYSLVSYEKE